MDHDEKYTMNEEDRMEEQEPIRCECCNNVLNDYETADPCEIDYHTFCDDCASNLTSLRLQGFIKQAADITKPLVEQHDRDLSWAMGYQLVPQRNIKHI